MHMMQAAPKLRLRFVLVAMTLSTWLMARASPTYCVIMVLSLGAVMVASHLDPEGPQLADTI